jgi:hypothetical protein
VPRYIYESDAQIRSQVQVRETEIDRNAAPLFFFQAIGIDARERSDERSFSVIDVASGAGNDPHGRTAYFRGVTLISLNEITDELS